MLIRNFIFLLFFFATTLNAQNFQYIVITLEHGENIPSADDVYQEGQLSSPPPNHLISAFDSIPPLELDYLMKIRAYGDLKTLIEQKPNWGRAIFERSLLLAYDQNADLPTIASTLSTDPHIQTVSVIGEGELAFSQQLPNSKQGNNNWHLDAVNWSGASGFVQGYGNIGFVDTGSLPERPEFSTFDNNSNTFLGGGLNTSKGYSTFYQDRDVSELRQIDETRLVFGPGLCDDFDSNPNDGFVMPDPKITGHGTHVSGLLAARSINTPGICENCYLSATQETRHRCVYLPVPDEHQVQPIVNLSSYAFSLRYLLSTGVQTASMSFMFDFSFDLCDQAPNSIQCIVISDAIARNVALVAAAGNHREPMGFPASDRDVIGVSGIQSDLNFWNESPTNGNHLPPLNLADPQNNDDCPFYTQPSPITQECGSNFSWPEEISPGVFTAERYRRVDVAAPARDVMSTLPVGSEYLPQVGDTGCTDGADGVIDGYGPCTGTSMSTPIVAGILQMIRSVNPLLPIGDDELDQLDGIRDILLFSGSEYQSNGEHSPWMGYGIPNGC